MNMAPGPDTLPPPCDPFTGSAPIMAQSMTNTHSADANAMVTQVAVLVRAGSEIVRMPVDRDEATAELETDWR